MRSSILFAFSSLMACMLAGGCDTTPRMDYSSVGLVDAHGTVTLDGRPLSAAVVTFEAPDGTFSYGMTDSEGEYQLQFDSDMQGVAPGPKTVRISTTRKILGLNADDGEAGELPEEGDAPTADSTEKERVPAKYNDKSELSVEVTPAQEEYNFDLTS